MYSEQEERRRREAIAAPAPTPIPSLPMGLPSLLKVSQPPVLQAAMGQRDPAAPLAQLANNRASVAEVPLVPSSFRFEDPLSHALKTRVGELKNP
jgi:hypothetical protein